MTAATPRPLRWLVATLALGSTVMLFLVAGTLGAAGRTQSGPTLGQAGPSLGAVASIPPEMLALYRQGGAEYGIDWAILAAIGAVESNHGRSQAPGVHSGLNFAGCCAGPMQFDVTDAGGNTWAAYGVDGNGDGLRNPYDPADAVPAAARYLVAHGAPGDYERAVFAYNHADWYVRKVLALAARLRSATPTVAPVDVQGLIAWLLANPHIVLTSSQRADLSAGRIDVRVAAVIALVATRHSVVVTALRSDHSYWTSEGNPSNHAFGRAVDIGAVDGERCTGTRAGSCGRLAIQLAGLTGWLHSTELIYCFDPDGAASSDAFARSDHCDHIHLGYDA